MLSVSSQEVKDKLCQRAIEKIKVNLTKGANVSKSHSEQTEETGLTEGTQETGATLPADTLRNEEGNSGEVYFSRYKWVSVWK